MKHLKLFENTNYNEMLDFQKLKSKLNRALTEYLELNYSKFWKGNDYIIDFIFSSNRIWILYFHHEEKHNEKIEIDDVEDFLLFFNNPNDYKKTLDIKKETDKYNL